MKQGLGTQLRHLLELLDGAVADAYAAESLNYRPRYTPIIRALLASESLSVTQIAEAAGITQPAATQTVTLMARDGLVSSQPNARDGRQRMIRLSPAGRALLPRLEACWRATTAAADSLDADCPYPLSEALACAIDALEQCSFAKRLAAGRPPTDD